MIWKAQKGDPNCLVIVDEDPRSGTENMDLDKQILEWSCQQSANDNKPPTICRLYRWEEPTVTLGYFQDPSVPVPAEINGCPRVKRLTGGGAILHDLELTYSAVLPAHHSIRHQPLDLYEVVHSAIIQVLAAQSIHCSLRQDSPLFGNDRSVAPLGKATEPFLCFLRQDDRDIVLGKHKIVGSAQRRRKGSILQHGSVLLRASKLVPEVLGLKNLAKQFDEDAFSDQLAGALGQSVAQKVEIQTSGTGNRGMLEIVNEM